MRKVNSNNIIQVTGHVNRCAFTAKSEFKVMVVTSDGTYEFKKTEPNIWVYRMRPACHLSAKPRLNVVFKATGTESVTSFFSKACRSVDNLINYKLNQKKHKDEKF